MDKRIAMWTIVCFFLSLSVVFVLYATSRIIRVNGSSFLREFPPHPATEGDAVNIKYNSYYIAGGTPHTVYFANFKTPLHLLALDVASLDTQHVSLDVKGIEGYKFWAAKVTVDSPYYYLTDGAVPVMFKGDVRDWCAEKFMYDSVFFRDILPINSGSFLVKSLSGLKEENIIGKITKFFPYQTFRTDILKKQLDGVFCTDGIMRYDKELHRLVYLYYYRNEFMVMDTSLTLIYTGSTIDTMSHAKIKTAMIESEDSRTISSPPYFVNLWCDVSDQKLFVNSNLRARNESAAAFEQGAVIDVYDMNDGKYNFSFYVYDIEGKRMTEFRVFGRKMIVRHEDVVRVYDLKPEYFENNERGADVFSGKAEKYFTRRIRDERDRTPVKNSRSFVFFN